MSPNLITAADPSTLVGFTEEVMFHEAAHTSLDVAHANAPGWREAQRADGGFISTYARDNPDREDIAESILPYFAVRVHTGRILLVVAARAADPRRRVPRAPGPRRGRTSAACWGCSFEEDRF